MKAIVNHSMGEISVDFEDEYVLSVMGRPVTGMVDMSYCKAKELILCLSKAVVDYDRIDRGQAFPKNLVVHRVSDDDAWIGVDFDGTLVKELGWEGPWHIGDPISEMVDRVKVWLAAGKRVKIFTARASGKEMGVRERIMAVEAWSEMVFGVKLDVVCEKDMNMVELWDDRCVRVEFNTGMILSGKQDNQ